jgi:TfoX/Sxy family transcriptional regulator of competence genes
MVKARLSELQSLFGPLARQMGAEPMGVRVALSFKPFFGGAAVYANDRICITLTSVGLGMKLPEQTRATLLREGAKPLRYFVKGQIKKQYVLFPDGVRANRRRLMSLARQSVNYVLGG